MACVGFYPTVEDFTPPVTAPPDGTATAGGLVAYPASVMTGSPQVACLAVEGHLIEELLYRYP